METYFTVFLVGGSGNGIEVMKPADQVNLEWCFWREGETYRYTEIDYNVGEAIAEFVR